MDTKSLEREIELLKEIVTLKERVLELEKQRQPAWYYTYDPGKVGYVTGDFVKT
jgi:hypothetical protein